MSQLSSLVSDSLLDPSFFVLDLRTHCTSSWDVPILMTRLKLGSIYNTLRASEWTSNAFRLLSCQLISNSTMSSIMAPVAKPTSRLARYRALSPYASIHVSPLQLGGMSIGDKWEQLGMGGMNKESSFKLLDAFYDAGGNFIDTANV